MTPNNFLTNISKIFSFFSLNYDCSKQRQLIHHEWQLQLNYELKIFFSFFLEWTPGRNPLLCPATACTLSLR